MLVLIGQARCGNENQFITREVKKTMVRYKLQFREATGKRYYNFGPTVQPSAKSKYSKISSLSQARSVRASVARSQPTRVWRIRTK